MALTRRCAVLFGSIAGAAAFLACGVAQAADDVHFILDWLPTGEHAAYYAGKAKGFFDQEGIAIRISRGYGSGDTATKIGAGVGQFGISDIAAVFTARYRQNTPIKTISVLYTASPHSLFVLKSSGITGFKGLEGKKIGITPGNSHKLYFPNVAARAGTDPNKIQWVTVDAAAMAPMLITKKIDAAPFYSLHYYYQNKAAKAAGEEIVVLPFVKTGFAIYAATFIASDKILDQNPDLARRFLRAAQTSLKFAHANPEETCRLHVQANPEVALDDCIGSLKAALGFVFNEDSEKTGLGYPDPARMQETYKVVAESQELDPNWDYKQALDFRFLPAKTH